MHHKRTKSATLGARHHHRGVGEASVHVVSAIIRSRPDQGCIEGASEIMSLVGSLATDDASIRRR
ncbi:hypothetical protein AGR8A_pTi10161 [Agrobacterium fabrum str. J-07]|nr:hypothetical protein AGR8A_pTi10161 [Agrobacterium fabrum str. J-07]